MPGPSGQSRLVHPRGPAARPGFPRPLSLQRLSAAGPRRLAGLSAGFDPTGGGRRGPISTRGPYQDTRPCQPVAPGASDNGCCGNSNSGRRQHHRPHDCCMATWLHGYMATWLHGYMATWLHGYMAAWLHGYMATLSRLPPLQRRHREGPGTGNTPHERVYLYSL